MFDDYEFGKKALRALIFRTSHDVDRQLNDKNVTLDLVLIRQMHHTFKNAVLIHRMQIWRTSAGPGLVARKRG